MAWGLHSTLDDQKGPTEGQSTQVTQWGEGFPFSLLTHSAPVVLPPLLLLTSEEGISTPWEGWHHGLLLPGERGMLEPETYRGWHCDTIHFPA